MNVHYTTQFKKNYKRLKKQNKDLSKLRIVIEKLSYGSLWSQAIMTILYLETKKITEIVTLNLTGF